MKTLNRFITEKLKITKNVKIYKDIINKEDFSILTCFSYNRAYDYINKNYEEYSIGGGELNPLAFALKNDIIKNISKKFNFNRYHICCYYIDDKYKSLKDLKEDWDNDKISYEDLKEIKFT